MPVQSILPSDSLPPSNAVRDYLARGWLTHDGMWFYNAQQELGIETANRLNLAAIRSMAPTEVRRTGKLLGMTGDRVESFDELYRFMRSALSMVLPETVLKMFTTAIPAPGVFRWEWKKGECFAYRGVSMMGCIDRYQCGVLMRIRCWLDILEVGYRMEPEITGCMMHEKGICTGDIICRFD